MTERHLRVLTFTSLFPNRQQLLHGLFVRERIKALSRFCKLQVIAPVPWAPAIPQLGERYYRYSQIAREEHEEDLVVSHPRFIVIPRALKVFDGFLMAAYSIGLLRAMQRSFQFDVIDAHWAYPDGFAAAILAHLFHVPFVLTVRGDDINVLPDFFWRRQLIRWTLRQAALVIALSKELEERVRSLSDVARKTVVIPNGINSKLFCPGERSEARRRLGIPLEGRILLSVGRLHSSKGYPLLVEALGGLSKEFHDLGIVIVGESDHEADARPAIEAVANSLGLKEKVKLVGSQPPSVVADWYRAADLFCLPTYREGSANVLLEALACGLPCITTPVGGNSDLISTAEVGILVNPEVKLLMRAISQGLARRWDRERIAEHVRKRTWACVAGECYENLSRVVALSRETSR